MEEDEILTSDLDIDEEDMPSDDFMDNDEM